MGSVCEKGVPSLLTGIVTALHALISIGVILLILLHSGRGSGMGDVFGGGMGGGAAGATTIEKNLDRLTVFAAILFSFTTLWLAWLWN